MSDMSDYFVVEEDRTQKVIDRLTQALTEISEAQLIIGPIKTEDGFTLGRDLAIVSWDLTLCLQSVINIYSEWLRFNHKLRLAEH